MPAVVIAVKQDGMAGADGDVLLPAGFCYFRPYRFQMKIAVILIKIETIYCIFKTIEIS